MEGVRQPCRTNPTRCASATFYSSTTAFSSYRWRYRASGLRRRSLVVRLWRPLAAWYRSPDGPHRTPCRGGAGQAASVLYRPPSRDLLTQRIDHIASGYADGNDAKRRRHDPVLQRRVERPPLAPAPALASAPPLPGLTTASTARTSPDFPTPWSPLASPALPSRPRPGCSTSLMLMPRPRASKHARFLTPPPGVMALCRSSFARGPHPPW